MATFRKRVNSKGEARFEAILRIKRRGVLVHRESRAFSRLALAREWARERERELERPGALAALGSAAAADATRLGTLVGKYREEFEVLGKWGRTKHAALKALEGMEVAQLDACTLTAEALVAHVRSRRLAGAGPVTAGQDLTWIGVVLKAARGVWGLPVQPYVVEEARTTCRALRLTGRARKRDRRPTDDELRRLLELAQRREDRAAGAVPLATMIRFAIASARRQDEITRLLWADLDEATHTIRVRDVKHPRAKAGNHRRAKLTAEALALILAQPRPKSEPDAEARNGEPRIFPVNTRSVSGAFTRACALLGIEDLRFHDLRHEATSRLFEAGYQIHEVAQFTLHESWQELKRYTQLRPEGLRLR